MQQVPGHVGAVNITLPSSNVFQFQVSATARVDGMENEGDLSVLTSNSTVFVPSTG